MTTNPQAQTEQEFKNLEFQFEIFKLEYEQAAQRYENIYKAIWQIFSYMSALAAAIVAFGANNLPLLIVVFIAPLPLFFWLVAIYIPMDFYGNRARRRLAEIEEGINTKFLQNAPPKLKLKHFRDFNKQPKIPLNDAQVGWCKKLWQPLKKLWQIRWRVRQAIFTFAVVAALAWILSLGMIVHNSSQLKPKFSRMDLKLEPPVQVHAQAPQLQGLESEIELLSKKLDSIESLLRARNITTPNNAGKP